VRRSEWGRAEAASEVPRDLLTRRTLGLVAGWARVLGARRLLDLVGGLEALLHLAGALVLLRNRLELGFLLAREEGLLRGLLEGRLQYSLVTEVNEMAFRLQLGLLMEEQPKCIQYRRAYHRGADERSALVEVALNGVKQRQQGACHIGKTVDDLTEFCDFLGDQRWELRFLVDRKLARLENIVPRERVLAQN